MFAYLQHGTSHAWAWHQPLEPAKVGEARVRGRRLTRPSSAACSRACTRYRRHARRQINEPAPAGQGAGSRPVASRGDHPLHVREPATRDIAGTRGRQMNEPAPVG
eukprot:scaffold21819_cov65-Phaeocystis_antarctica.AAC.3